MHGHRHRFRPSGGGRGAAQPSAPPPPRFCPPNPNIYFQNPNPYLQNPNIFLQNPGFSASSSPYLQNPTFPPQQFPSTVFQPQNLSQKPNELLQKIDRAVAKAHRDILAAGENVSSWKVSQAALLSLQVDSWSSLGFKMQEIPSLHRLIVVEGKIDAFIHCFVGVRRITSLYDLDVAICKNESIDRFEELELGPLLRHPLVLHYFSVPPDAMEIVQIRSEEIISCIAEFMDIHQNKEIRAEEFLDYLAKKMSVATREKLGVRIQSLGMHISFIREARKAEDNALKKSIQAMKPMLHEQSSKGEGQFLQKSSILSQKKVLDRRFNSISQRIKSFSSAYEDFGAKHIKFISSSSDDESGDDSSSEDDDTDENDLNIQGKALSQNKKSYDKCVSSCPYPSATEEMTRLGLKSNVDGHASLTDESRKLTRKKRKFGNQSGNGSLPQKQPKRGKVELNEAESNLLLRENYGRKEDTNQDKVGDLRLGDDSMEMFITTWKEACQELTVAQVFGKMLQFYKLTTKKRKKMKSVISLYPFIGLLNVAVASIKNGIWDSLYDTFQAIGQHGFVTPISDPSNKPESIDVGPDEQAAAPINELVPKLGCSITVEDVMKKVALFFELDHDIPIEGKMPLESQLICLRKLRNCELWLTEQFSVKEFDSIGYGDFLIFLERHASLLPNELCRSLTLDISQKSSLEVSMLKNQLVALLSQAITSLGENHLISNQHICMLLKKQFPLICFEITGNEPSADLLESLSKKTSISTSSCVLFSVVLLGTGSVGDSLVLNGKHSTETTAAVECLLKAPMLSDLQSWSHWDHVFAPSLGPFIEWLLSEVDTKDLMCLVTRDSKVIKIDHSATVDEFLEALLQGSSFQTAVKLLSLVALYGGQKHIPMSLLKCHAQRAIEVMIKNSVDSIESKGRGDLSIHETSLREQILDVGSLSNQLLVNLTGGDVNRLPSNELFENLSNLNKAIPVASRFILECLSYLPSEFRSLGVDILFLGLRSVTKNAALAILHECKNIDQRLMLHDLGLSLGILEWIEDYHAFCSTNIVDLLSSHTSTFKDASPAFNMNSNYAPDSSMGQFSSKGEIMVAVEEDAHNKTCFEIHDEEQISRVSNDTSGKGCAQILSENGEEDASLVIEIIRREEFGLDSSLTAAESSILQKQHARLGRALHCLSQELYSQDSHFLLELVQNADDNMYPENVEPTLVFILRATGIVILNNEQGFSAQNIRALCDVGNSTKKGSSGGYIGQKGIGFKSVFRVTDAPEIHSNGFHVKYDISEGQIGFVLPTTVPPCDISLFNRMLSTDDTSCWNTCIVLPFRSKLIEGTGMNSILSMFSDLHPSLLLFLHRLQCIKFRNVLNDSLTVMRRETMGDGIVKVSHGNMKMSWFVETQKLQASVIRPDVQTTEIAVAFTLKETDDGEYKPQLDQQPVFAFLPLRTYGLKFILQGDFVLPSSREEVDGDSAWNQWLLSQFPGLFISAERSLCALPCFQDHPGKAVTAYMSFVPLVGEVHGFFSHLPRMIISKLRMSNCLLLEGDSKEWVPPCKVLRCWNEQSRVLLPDSLLHQHLGLGYLDKDIVLSDPLAKALGIEEYGTKVLIDIISSICHTNNGINALGLNWLSSWINAVFTMSIRSTETKLNESDLISLRKIPFIPLSDGTYGSLAEGTIWLPSDAFSSGFDGEYCTEAFPSLYAKLRTVNPALLSATAGNSYNLEELPVENIVNMLSRIGVQRLSAHEIIKAHILPAISDDNVADRDKSLMTEYLSFVMLHLQSSCPNCCIERVHIISELRGKAFILTNYGYRRPSEVSIHFSREFGNPVDVNRLLDATESNWHEVDIIYLKYPSSKSSPSGLSKWRDFFQELGITDFVQIVQVEKNITDISHTVLMNMLSDKDLISSGSIIKDWESPELVHLLSTLSSKNKLEECMHLLEILDKLWDDCFSEKVTGQLISKCTDFSKPIKSSFINNICSARWVVSSIDKKLNYPKDLFYDCEAVRSILGDFAPYAVPKVRNRRFLSHIGFKTQVTLDDALTIIHVWRGSGTPFKASIAQMSKFYSFIWSGSNTAKAKISELSSGPFVFVPLTYSYRHDDVISGVFLSPEEVYWNDVTGSVDQVKELILQCGSINESNYPLIKTLSHIYPGLHDFFVHECGVREIPSFCSYLQILLHLSRIAVPCQAANAVFKILIKWTDDLKLGLVDSEDIIFLKECLHSLEYTVLPTLQDTWVSLHSSFGVVCWSDDEKLRKQFKDSENLVFLYFGELENDEKEMVLAKLAVLMKTIGIPSLSEVINREAIFYGMEDCTSKASLVNWVLPYAQRYIYKLHPDKYFEFKHSNFEILSNLRVVVVEKLFYRNTIKGCDSVSKKRFECSCLLQGNILYLTEVSDSHSIFMELSRLFFNGVSELHFANFLHMITTMAESGSSEDQTEFFILNSQKVPKLPEEETIWSLTLSQEDNGPSQPICASALSNMENLLKSKRKPGIIPNWPPADWKTAPDFSISRTNHLRTKPVASHCSSTEGKAEGATYEADHGVPVGISSDWIIQDDSSVTTIELPFQDSGILEDHPLSVGCNSLVSGGIDPTPKVLNKPVDPVTVCEGSDILLLSNERDQLSIGTPNEKQAVITGRVGELLAFNYLAKKVGKEGVKWVNEEKETGLPYDIVIGNDEEKEYIEVKATRSSNKDWFTISTREWQFAVDRGEGFSIVHVVLGAPKNARITVFKNPVRLCQQGALQLAILMTR
uniref:Protein NO VEIN C-terminal domain-containing protein n=1 Tax=Nelumbo nucifera TaxID=4432 RepID=A0A822XYB0_NELNU|nr:TPA_asm: hypothetical protein HUJ06_025449 [Nelumbo nucifera]